MQVGSIKQRGAGKVVLIVDDSHAIRKMLKCVFQLDGFTDFVEADSGKEAIEAVRQRKPDLIVLDLAMPVMGGLEAAPQLRRLLPETPIILFTLYSEEFLNPILSSSGVTLVLGKCSPISTILAKVQELLRS
jgi:two-component system response regulator (stage 0 sporulation protein F)